MAVFSLIKSSILISALLATLTTGLAVRPSSTIVIAQTAGCPYVIPAVSASAPASAARTTSTRRTTIRTTTTRRSTARTTTTRTTRTTTARASSAQTSSSLASSTRTSSTQTSSVPTSAPGFWQPKAGTTYQIVLKNAVKDTTPDASVYILDLYDNPKSTIDKLHSLNRKVICYFSAGSYEDWRTDAKSFTKADYGKPLDPIWVGEWWLDTRRENVRKIMVERMKLAKSKGCDGVDPDNIDGFTNDTGFNMKAADGIDYMKFMAREAHALGLAIGLKNGGSIVKQVLNDMQWEVNEQCLEFDECNLLKPFIDANKPVFHIEYPEASTPYSTAVKQRICGKSSIKGFSTLLKDINLTDYYERC